MPLALQGSRKGGCEWVGGGSEGTSDRERDRVGNRHSLKPPLLPLLPSPVEGRGCQGRASRALGNSPRPPDLPLPGGEAPPRTEAPNPPPPPSGSCCCLRLRSGSTSFLRRESARVVCCWGVRGRRFHLARWAWAPGAGAGPSGLGKAGAYCRGLSATSPHPHPQLRGFQEGSPTRSFSSSVQPPTRRCSSLLSILCGVARMPQAKGLASPWGYHEEQDFSCSQEAPSRGGARMCWEVEGQVGRKQRNKHNS